MHHGVLRFVRFEGPQKGFSFQTDDIKREYLF